MKPEPTRSHDDLPADETRRLLSALADGDREALPRACELWRHDEQARQTWHAYHLIGDVLRSEDLALPAARDAAFLGALRARLASEPVALVPAARHNAGWAQAWRVPAAAAAGVAVVAGVLLVARAGDPAVPPLGSTLAAASAAGIPLDGVGAQRALTVQRAGTDGIIRDARLDEYLRAHQAVRGGVAVAAPGGTLRRADALVPANFGQ
jgi:sigma-E factor negative regulatory protein RseA